MTQTIVELHVPLVPGSDVSGGEDDFPWIEAIEEHIAELEDAGIVELYDDGEEWRGENLFFLTGRSEAQLLAAAAEILARPGVPAGGYVTVNTPEGDMGEGRRVALPDA